MCGLGVISTFATSQNSISSTTENHYALNEHIPMEACASITASSPWSSLPAISGQPGEDLAATLVLESILFIENDEEATVELGFDTAPYLPVNFDPYGAFHEVVDVAYLEEELPVEIGFETTEYLPANFNPYSVPQDFMDVSYIEAEEDMNLGFDPTSYLPAGFNPYETYFDLDAVVYIEEEEEVILDFNPKDYLPVGFNPYSR